VYDGAADGPGGQRADRPLIPVPRRGRDRGWASAWMAASGENAAAVACRGGTLSSPRAAGLADRRTASSTRPCRRHRGKVVREQQRVMSASAGARSERDGEDRFLPFHSGPGSRTVWPGGDSDVDMGLPGQGEIHASAPGEPGPRHPVKERGDATRRYRERDHGRMGEGGGLVREGEARRDDRLR